MFFNRVYKLNLTGGYGVVLVGKLGSLGSYRDQRDHVGIKTQMLPHDSYHVVANRSNPTLDPNDSTNHGATGVKWVTPRGRNGNFAKKSGFFQCPL